MVQKARFQFDAMGTWQIENNPIEFGYNFPGSVSLFRYRADAPAEPRWIRRFHPVSQEIDHSYELNFRFGSNESSAEVTRNSWCWAWSALKPAVYSLKVIILAPSVL